MAAAVWINGELLSKLAAKVSLLDHGVLFGDGVTTGFRLKRGEPVRLGEHLSHLEATAARIKLKLPYDRTGMTAAVTAAITASGRTEGYVKLVVTRGAGMLGVDPRKCEPCVAVIVDDLLPYPPELRTAGLSLAVSRSVTRRPGNVADRGFLLANAVAVLGITDALAAGCLDALVLDDTGFVTGTTSGVVFMVKSGELLTPSFDLCPDPVVRAAVLALAPGLGWSAREVAFTPAELVAADEAFFAGSGFGAVGITAVDGTPVRRGDAAGRVDAGL